MPASHFSGPTFQFFHRTRTCGCLQAAPAAVGTTEVDDGSGPPAAGAIHSGWALDRVELLNHRTGMQGSYPYGSWLNMPAACATLRQASATQVRD
jgi:hypothetical protein